jgi:hypothetical protein
MANIPARIETRLSGGVKRFQPILASAKSRDVNESDTVIIVTDMLSEIFGYDKYSEITSEHAIRGTYCDLATILEGKTELLVEVKPVGIELKDSYLKQAVDYAANKGVDWVVLTNGVLWRVYRVLFNKPIDSELVFEIDFLSLDLKIPEQLERVFVLTKEGWIKKALGNLHVQRQALNKFLIAAVVASAPVVEVVRRELRRVCPDVKILPEQVEQVILSDVLKREVVEGEKADDAKKKLSKCANRTLRSRGEKELDTTPAPAPVLVPNLPTPLGTEVIAPGIVGADVVANGMSPQNGLA